MSLHAMSGTRIDVGDNLDVGDDSTIYSLVETGDNLIVGDDSVVFRVRVGNKVTVGDDVGIQGSASEGGELELEIPDNANIPDGAVIAYEESLQQALQGQ